MTEAGDSEWVAGSVVTASFFRVLGVQPLTGRTLLDEDERRGSARVVVLGESLWRRRFGSDAGIVGRSVVLDGERYQVAGVMPRSFREVGRARIGATADPQLFLPLTIDRALENRGNHTLRVAGRLRRGVSLAQAREEMRAVAASMEREFPASNANWGVRIETVAGTMVDPDVRRALILLLGAVAMVLLIACANVANLLLARGARRQAELAVPSGPTRRQSDGWSIAAVDRTKSSESSATCADRIPRDCTEADPIASRAQPSTSPPRSCPSAR